MRRVRHLSHRLSWLTCWVILLGALAPLTSPWLMRAAPPEALPWLKVCSAQPAGAAEGRQRDSSPEAPAHHARAASCMYCALHVDALALPPAPWRFSALPRTAQALVADVAMAPVGTRVAWRAQPRAPPALS